MGWRVGFGGPRHRPGCSGAALFDDATGKLHPWVTNAVALSHLIYIAANRVLESCSFILPAAEAFLLLTLRMYALFHPWAMICFGVFKPTYAC